MSWFLFVMYDLGFLRHLCPMKDSSNHFSVNLLSYENFKKTMELTVTTSWLSTPEHAPLPYLIENDFPFFLYVDDLSLWYLLWSTKFNNEFNRYLFCLLNLTVNSMFHPFLHNVPFWSPWKQQKTKGFLIFSGGSKGNIGKKKVKLYKWQNCCKGGD